MTALGDPTRRAIFERLADGPMAVGAIALGLPVSRPAVSQHLKVLKQAGLVSDRPVANRRLYSIDPRGIEEIHAYFDRYLNRALHAFKTAAEQGTGGNHMATQLAGTSVRASVIVEAPIEHAFSVFTEQMGTWWPKDHHVLEGELAEMVFEPRVGGNVYDRRQSTVVSPGGRECSRTSPRIA